MMYVPDDYMLWLMQDAEIAVNVRFYDICRAVILIAD